jgi:hypothetical protein
MNQANDDSFLPYHNTLAGLESNLIETKARPGILAL